MDRKDAEKRVIALRKTINYHRHNYHVLDTEEISAEALDSLKKELFDIEQTFPDLVTPDSPTQRVAGKPLPGFVKVRHEAPMSSLNDVFSEDDAREWFMRVKNFLGRTVRDEFYCELKIDGFAIELTYENGLLVRGATRGNGLVGEDVTQNLKTIEAIPLSLTGGDIPKHLVVRGEVFLSKKEFVRINKEIEKKGGAPYANPRNVAAGAIRQLDPTIVASRKLDSFAYDIVIGKVFKTHAEEHEQLKKWGFKTNSHNKIVHGLDNVFEFWKHWESHKETLSYEIDGLVVMVNNNDDFVSAGIVGKAPRGAVAFKFSPKEATTIVEHISVQVGRTGTLTPVAHLAPVKVGGVTIRHATLHNYDEIKRLGLKIGDTVIVSRAGDVIPKITKVLPEMRSGKEKNFSMPKNCPIDGSLVVQDGAYYRCSNKLCGARARRTIEHFVSRGAYDMRGLGTKIIDRFIDEGLITDYADIFSLKEEDIAVLPRFGELSAKNIVTEIEQKKKISLARFIYALGIPHVGEETGRILAQLLVSNKAFSGKEAKPNTLLKALSGFSRERLEATDSIGPKIAGFIVEWFAESAHKKIIEKLDHAGVLLTIPQEEEKGKLAGLSFVFTGTLTTLSRERAKEMARKAGGTVHGSVSKKTTYVVAGTDAGSKLKNAQALGVNVITEDAFLKMVQ
jgi:DNA ligase (NAD+)